MRGIRILAEEIVTVGGGGGFANLSFSADANQTIFILMQSESSTMEPYGFLSLSDEEGDYTPENGTSVRGKNSSEVTLGRGGSYTLTVFDGTNRGGVVHVRIELLK